MKLALLATALLLAGAASAQTVWRCGPDGRSYSDTPCADGRVVAVADPRSAADVAQARAVAARELALARELVQQRRDRENEALALSRAPSARHGGASPVETGIRPSAKAAKAVKAAKAEPATRKATAPAPPTRPPAGGGTSPAAARGSPRTMG